MQVTVVDHPLAAQLLTRLRQAGTDRAGFRLAMDDLSAILVYEASRDIEVESIDIETPLGPTRGTRLSRPPLVVPVLRAGLTRPCTGTSRTSKRGFPSTATCS